MKNSVIKQGGRTVIAMAHVPALPGSPDYKLHEGMQKLHDWVGRDIEALQSGGTIIYWCTELVPVLEECTGRSCCS